MSAMRDARLKRALESAPDDQVLPVSRVRQAVRDAARTAVAPASQPAWWVSLWRSLGDRNMPWNAALAAVVVATLVTVLWHDREIPGARPDGPQADQPAAVAPPQAAPVPPPAAPAPVLAPVPKAAAPAVKPQPEPPRERRAEATVDALRDAPARDLAKSSPAPQVAEASTPPDAGAGTRAAAPLEQSAQAPAAAAPAPAAAPPAAMARATAPAMASRRDSPLLANDWTHLRVVADGRSIDLARDQAPRLALLLNGVARQNPSQESLETPVSIRVELLREGEPAGVIELAGPQVRWTSRGESFTVRPQAARLEAAREEIVRLLPR